MTAPSSSQAAHDGRLVVIPGALAAADWLSEAGAAPFADLPAVADWLRQWRAQPPQTFDDGAAVVDELAHERWLRGWLAGDPAVALPAAPGQLAAARGLGDSLAGGSWRISPADMPEATCWLAEPTHLHVATDHLVLLHGAAATLTEADAADLLQAVRPQLDEIGLGCLALAPRGWLLWAQATDDQPSDGPAVAPSAAAAQGHNVDVYLPRGPAGRPLRRLINASQMAWHEHPVNEARRARGEPAINSLWISGPCRPDDIGRWRDASSDGLLVVDDGPLWPRLNGDRDAWRQALAAALSRAAQDEPAARRIVLCGERSIRVLQPADAQAGIRPPGGDRGRGSSTTRPASSGWRSWLSRLGGGRDSIDPAEWFIEP